MNKQSILSIISITLLLLLSLQTVLGKNTLPTTTPIHSPLFDNQQRTLYIKTSNDQYHTNYLGNNINDCTHYYFPQRSHILTQPITLLKKYISHQDLINVITKQYQHKNPKEFPQPIPAIISKTLQNTPQSPNTFTLEKQLTNLTDPFSTVFPTCILLVIITIILLYGYILLFEVTDFILQVLENLF